MFGSLERAHFPGVRLQNSERGGNQKTPRAVQVQRMQWLNGGGVLGAGQLSLSSV
jgi:hypothetical protein